MIIAKRRKDSTMLVLSRERNETVVFVTPDGDEYVVTVAEIRGDRVRLGFDAPKDVLIHRGEVLERIKQGVHPSCSRNS